MKKLWLLVFVLMLSACGFSAGNIPADHFYRLPSPVPVNVVKAVNVKSVQADGIYNERAILFVDKNYPLELNRYSYHFWAQNPSQLARIYLQGCLTDSGSAKSMDETRKVVQLSPVIESFERVLQNGQSEAVVKLRISQRVYEARVSSKTMEMHATVDAFGQALQEICVAIARDI